MGNETSTAKTVTVYEEDEKTSQHHQKFMVYTIGSNRNGQQLLDSNADKVIRPVNVPGIKNKQILSIYTSSWGSTYLHYADNSVSVGGYNKYGQLGLKGNYQDVSSLMDWDCRCTLLSKGIGSSHMFIKKSGSEQIYCCGYNRSKQFGVATGSKKHSEWIAVDLPNRLQIKSIITSSAASFFLTMSGVLLSCGSSDYGELALGQDVKAVTKPTPIKRKKKIKAIAAGLHHCIAINEEDVALGWGLNTYGQAGHGEQMEMVYSPLVIGVMQHQRIAAVDCGQLHSLFLASNGAVFACGMNNSAQCGDGTVNKFVYGPKKIALGAAAQRIQCGQHHNVIRTKKDHYLFGCNKYAKCLVLDDKIEKVLKPTRYVVPPKWKFKDIRIIAGDEETRIIVTSDELGDFLGGIGLGKYESKFREEGFETMDLLSEVTDDELNELKVGMGDRKKLKKAMTKYFNLAAREEKTDETESAGIASYRFTEPNKRVNDGLFVFLGVSKYDGNLYETLDDIHDDAEHFRKIFEGKYHYEFMSNRYDEPYPEYRVIDFLDGVQRELLGKNDTCAYNGLIICIASHGSENSMICSDGKEVTTRYIRSLFSAQKHPQLQHIPKVFVMNFCRRDTTDPTDKRKGSGSISYSVSITACEGKEAFGSKISKHVSNAFGEACENGMRLGKIMARAQETARADKLQLRLQEHDLRIDEVVFAKCASSTQQSRGRNRHVKDTRQTCIPSKKTKK